MGVSLQEDGPTFKVGCPGERLVNVALPDGVPSQARQLRDDRHLTASRHPGQEAVDISQSLSTVQAPFKRRARWFGRGAGFAACGLYRQNALKMADSVNGAPWHSRLFTHQEALLSACPRQSAHGGLYLATIHPVITSRNWQEHRRPRDEPKAVQRQATAKAIKPATDS
jgi:hypothetical protein